MSKDEFMLAWVYIILGLLLAIPTYGISLPIAYFLILKNGKKKREIVIYSLIDKSLMLGERVEDNNVFYEAVEKFARENDFLLSGIKDTSKVTMMSLDTPKGMVVINASKTASGGVSVFAKFLKKANDRD